MGAENGHEGNGTQTSNENSFQLSQELSALANPDGAALLAKEVQQSNQEAAVSQATTAEDMAAGALDASLTLKHERLVKEAGAANAEAAYQSDIHREATDGPSPYAEEARQQASELYGQAAEVRAQAEAHRAEQGGAIERSQAVYAAAERAQEVVARAEELGVPAQEAANDPGVASELAGYDITADNLEKANAEAGQLFAHGEVVRGRLAQAEAGLAELAAAEESGGPLPVLSESKERMEAGLVEDRTELADIDAKVAVLSEIIGPATGARLDAAVRPLTDRAANAEDASDAIDRDQAA